MAPTCKYDADAGIGERWLSLVKQTVPAKKQAAKKQAAYGTSTRKDCLTHVVEQLLRMTNGENDGKALAETVSKLVDISSANNAGGVLAVTELMDALYTMFKSTLAKAKFNKGKLNMDPEQLHASVLDVLQELVVATEELTALKAAIGTTLIPRLAEDLSSMTISTQKRCCRMFITLLGRSRANKELVRDGLITMRVVGRMLNEARDWEVQSLLAEIVYRVSPKNQTEKTTLLRNVFSFTSGARRERLVKLFQAVEGPTFPEDVRRFLNAINLSNVGNERHRPLSLEAHTVLYHGIAGDTIVLRSAFPAPLGVRSSQDTAVHMQKGTVTETNAATTMWVDFNAESVSLVFDSTNGSAVDEPTPCLIELVYQKDISGWRVEEEFNATTLVVYLKDCIVSIDGKDASMQQFSGGCWCKFTFSREVQGSARDGVTVDVAERLRFLLKSHQPSHKASIAMAPIAQSSQELLAMDDIVTDDGMTDVLKGLDAVAGPPSVDPSAQSLEKRKRVLERAASPSKKNPVVKKAQPLQQPSYSDNDEDVLDGLKPRRSLGRKAKVEGLKKIADDMSAVEPPTEDDDMMGIVEDIPKRGRISNQDEATSDWPFAALKKGKHEPLVKNDDTVWEAWPSQEQEPQKKSIKNATTSSRKNTTSKRKKSGVLADDHVEFGMNGSPIIQGGSIEHPTKKPKHEAHGAGKSMNVSQKSSTHVKKTSLDFQPSQEALRMSTYQAPATREHIVSETGSQPSSRRTSFTMPPSPHSPAAKQKPEWYNLDGEGTKNMPRVGTSAPLTKSELERLADDLIESTPLTRKKRLQASMSGNTKVDQRAMSALLATLDNSNDEMASVHAPHNTQQFVFDAKKKTASPGMFKSTFPGLQFASASPLASAKNGQHDHFVTGFASAPAVRGVSMASSQESSSSAGLGPGFESLELAFQQLGQAVAMDVTLRAQHLQKTIRTQLETAKRNALKSWQERADAHALKMEAALRDAAAVYEQALEKEQREKERLWKTVSEM